VPTLGPLHKFFVQHNCRSQERIQDRLRAIYQATSAIRDAAMLEAGPVMVKEMIAVIRALRSNIDELDQRIQRLASAHAENAIFAGLPGAGPVLQPRIIAAFGTNRRRYASAHDLLSYSGIAPVTGQSGRTKWVHFRRSCPKFLRQTFHEFASHSMAKCAWARAYYNFQINHGKKHHAAVRALAFKWIRILFRCWKDHQPYDEQTYVRALQKRGSPLAQALATHLEWKSVAGFKKLSQQNS
jgi:transposase